ncbi:DUF3108 domain-containing protein [Acidovorax radicis]|uniref:DUF3108 domain-containing protein n=1 Tax=Acidovorax radicis TaxID=758826 RepID=UPI001CF95088|nr:DUF3108 domain-containing protein [Acidovorax radicis]UCU99667.1 DUF3108 domain-containing protein [Acidovorax radicis]
MPRRALFFITALVLALHWLVLHGVPLAWDTPRSPSATRAFSTRSIPPPSPPAPVGTAPAPPDKATPPAARAPKPKPKGPARKAPRPQNPAEVAQPSPPTAEPPPEPAIDQARATDQPADATSPPGNGNTEVADATTAGSPSAPGDTGTLPAAAPASAPANAPPDDTPTGAGVDISPPGAASAHAGQGASTTPPPVRLPAPTRLAYDVSGQAKKLSYSARAELLWQHDGSHYEARQEVSLFLLGSRSQKSVGQITPQGLAPERFSDRARSEQAAHFDQAKGRVTFSANTPEAAVGPGAQDRLSIFIQLGALLAGDPERFTPGTQITLTTVSARSADRWTFTVEGPETLELPAGSTPTLKLQRLPRRDYDQKAELWVAPALGYLPVRIKLTQANGDFADLRLRGSSAP